MRKGKEIEVLVNRDAPQNIAPKSLVALLTISFVFPAVFLGIGGGILYAEIHKQQKRKKLREIGVRIEAQITNTYINNAIHVNGRHPYKIECRWNDPATGNVYVFTSGNIWDNPDYFISQTGVSTVPVYYNPQKIKQYDVAVDELANNAGQQVVHL